MVSVGCVKIVYSFVTGCLNKIFCCVFAVFLCLFYVNPVYSFSFKNDVASKFFWTKSYKDKHPKPANNMPKTMNDYYRHVNKAAADSMVIPSPHFEKDDKLVDLPDPSVVVVRYNNPPGKVEINLNKLIKKRQVNSIGVVSPHLDKMVYSTIYYYPSTKTAGSELFLMKLDMSKDLKQRIEDAHVNNGRTTLYRTQMDSLELDIQKTLTVLDWSVDATKLAIIEKISFSPEGRWRTNLIVYDFENNTVKDLSEVREAVQYYWRENYDLLLKDIRWDIYPIGWDFANPDRLVVYAYAFTGENPKFLGTWSIDYKGQRAMLLSLVETDFEVSQNGFCLQTELKN